MHQGRTTSRSDSRQSREIYGLSSFLPTYFSALNEVFPGLACIIETGEPPDVVAELVKDQRRSPQYGPQEVVDFAGEWCRQYKVNAQRGAGHAA
jgi:hypothetical protein